jgi:hypothetical protein
VRKTSQPQPSLERRIRVPEGFGMMIEKQTLKQKFDPSPNARGAVSMVSLMKEKDGA